MQECGLIISNDDRFSSVAEIEAQRILKEFVGQVANIDSQMSGEDIRAKAISNAYRDAFEKLAELKTGFGRGPGGSAVPAIDQRSYEGALRILNDVRHEVTFKAMTPIERMSSTLGHLLGTEGTKKKSGDDMFASIAAPLVAPTGATFGLIGFDAFCEGVAFGASILYGIILATAALASAEGIKYTIDQHSEFEYPVYLSPSDFPKGCDAEHWSTHYYEPENYAALGGKERKKR